jgi:hypothetical protein
LRPSKPRRSDGDVVADYDGDPFDRFGALEEEVSGVEQQRLRIDSRLTDLEAMLARAQAEREHARRA